MHQVPSYQVRPGVKYIHHPAHRNGSANKSQWVVTEPQERQSFTDALVEGWIEDTEGWGLHRPEGTPEVLGVAQDHATEVYIAKFVDSSETNDWHGYPADHQRHQQDIPDEHILRDWMEQGVLTAAKTRKIMCGQPCSL